MGAVCGRKKHQWELREPAVLSEALQGDMIVMFRVSEVKTEIGHVFAGFFPLFRRKYGLHNYNDLSVKN